MDGHITIEKNLLQPNSVDYYFLRQKGIDYITQLGSRWWTDYNLHDPGITTLEALAYALTELGYRTKYEIRDLIATPEGVTLNPNLQALFSARRILTVNPWTVNDFRKLLIDLDGVKNAWLVCKQCPCETKLYVNCKKSELGYDPPAPPEKPEDHEVFAKGLYDVLLEFDDDERLGDLNSGKIRYQFSKTKEDADPEIIYMEVRFPSYEELRAKITTGSDASRKLWKEFISVKSEVTAIKITSLSGNKTDNVIIADDKLANALRKPMYVTLRVEYNFDGTPIADPIIFEDVPFNLLLLKDAVRKELKVADLLPHFESLSPSGILNQYLQKIRKTKQVIADATAELHQHRNLAEDYCSVKGVSIEDIAVCADMEVTPDSDIEKILAEAYYLISNYFAPEIKFYSLAEWLEEGRPVDEIFDGPRLSHGFIDTNELEKASLKKVLFTSDIINLLMDIPGVKAIKNMVLVRYDKDGKATEAQSWKLEVTANHQPRLFIEASKFLVFKNNLPFLPDISELVDTLQVIMGANLHPKLMDHELDLEFPEGKYQSWNDYYPVQYSYPLTYGIGWEGLPSDANALRRAQAKQLKAYLLFFEQLLVDYLAQLSHVSDLFSLDQSIDKTYFSRLLADSDISGIETSLYDGLNATNLQNMLENGTTFRDRRNRFLNHLLARFAEDFSDFAMMLYATFEKDIADEKLIKNKIAFLSNYPFISRNRARSFNYKLEDSVCNTNNLAGLYARIASILGYEEYINFFEFSTTAETTILRLVDDSKNVLLESVAPLPGGAGFRDAESTISDMLSGVGDNDRYDIRRSSGLKFKLNLLDKSGNIIASHGVLYRTKAEAETARDEIILFAGEFLTKESFHIVEHLLLRPRFTKWTLPPDGDPLLPICVGPDCSFCGDEDPYSFRLTFVMQGESGLASTNIPFRRFAEDTIRLESPAHLAVKICWVSKKQYEEFTKAYCEWLKVLAIDEPNPAELSSKLKALLNIFNQLKSVYPPASLHDCVDGNDENRVYLDQTIISKKKKKES